MALGEAAGIAAALAVQQRRSPQELAATELLAKLRAKNAGPQRA
jgi:hypothetical protein